MSRKPPEVLALAALFAGAAVSLVLAVVFPMSEHAPVHLGEVLIVVAVAMIAFTLVYGPRLPRSVLLGEATLAAVLNSVVVGAAHTQAGAVADAFAYVWLTVYVGVFFPRAVHAYAALCAAGFGIGLLVADIGGLATAWAVISLATWMAGAVLAYVSTAVRRRLGTDALTGALNREGLDHALGRAGGASDDVVVAAIDLDGFKQINDAQGHAEGDRLLTEAALAWKDELRGDDVLARTGGDEFVLVMPRTSREQADSVLERLKHAHPVRWCAGVTRWRPGEEWADCLARADQRLYAAKAARER